ncbi:MAG TPA: hypothetical protein VK031_06720 [Tissierellaceae bacterium]|nr:hypothetical protein [Tissierellaceae bacterium]
MAGFDPKKISGLTEKINKAKRGSTKILEARQLETDRPRQIRLLKPLPNQGSEWDYAIEGLGYWINQKYYRSPASIGEECPIEDEIQKARKLNKPSINSLLSDWRNFSRDYAFYMPIVPVKPNIDLDTGEVVSSEIAGPERVLKAPISLMEGIQEIVQSPSTIAGSKGWGIFHPELGYSITIKKTGSGKDTRYSAILDPSRVPVSEEHYKPYDIVGHFKQELKPNEELRAAIRSYLYGEEYDVEDLEEGDTEPKKKQATKSKKTEKVEDDEVLDIDNLEDSDDELLGTLMEGIDL